MNRTPPWKTLHRNSTSKDSLFLSERVEPHLTAPGTQTRQQERE